jgi:hypothetical protein
MAAMRLRILTFNSGVVRLDESAVRAVNMPAQASRRNVNRLTNASTLSAVALLLTADIIPFCKNVLRYINAWPVTPFSLAICKVCLYRSCIAEGSLASLNMPAG